MIHEVPQIITQNTRVCVYVYVCVCHLLQDGAAVAPQPLFHIRLSYIWP